MKYLSLFTLCALTACAAPQPQVAYLHLLPSAELAKYKIVEFYNGGPEDALVVPQGTGVDRLHAGQTLTMRWADGQYHTELKP